MGTKDPTRDFAAYAPSHHWYKMDGPFHEAEYGFRLKRNGTVLDVGVHRDRGDTRWTAEVNVLDGPNLYHPVAFKTKRAAQVWAECAMQSALDAAAEYRALKVAQAEELQPYKDAATEAAEAANTFSRQQRDAEAEWIDAICASVTIPPQS